MVWSNTRTKNVSVEYACLILKLFVFFLLSYFVNIYSASGNGWTLCRMVITIPK